MGDQMWCLAAVAAVLLSYILVNNVRMWFALLRILAEQEQINDRHRQRIEALERGVRDG